MACFTVQSAVGRRLDLYVMSTLAVQMTDFSPLGRSFCGGKK